jgi:ABC-type Fe3+/spermidine/putrescine transport system ATPase subunit
MVMSDRIILMNRGRIVQESSPRDLYERPASRFAAEFVGSANLLEAKVIAEHGGGRFTVRLGEAVELQASAAVAGWQPGADGAALVCIRPENIAPAAEGIAAVVTRVNYLGATQTCEMAAGGLMLRADLPSHTPIVEGAEMRLRIDPSCVLLVPET